MPKIFVTSIEYEEHFPLADIRYTFESEIFDPETIGHHLKHLSKSVEHHLLSNNIYDYQLLVSV